MRIVICPPQKTPMKRLNAFGRSKPDNRPAAPPPVKSRIGERAKRESTLNLSALEAKAKRMMARATAERELKGQRDPEPEGLMPSNVPAQYR